MWGGSEEKESIETIRAALDQGITVVDYGAGLRIRPLLR